MKQSPFNWGFVHHPLVIQQIPSGPLVTAQVAILREFFLHRQHFRNNPGTLKARSVDGSFLY